MAVLDFGGRFYQSDSLPISAQECVNLYLNPVETLSPTKKSLFVTPGLVEVATAGTDVVNRGGHVFQDVPYVVNGTTLFRIDVSTDVFGVDTYTAVDVSGGVSLPGTGRVIMSDNGSDGDQLCIVLPDQTNQFNAFIYTKDTNILVAISDGDFAGPVSSVIFVDGFFLFTQQDSQIFFTSELRDGLAYLATDFATAESDPDSLVAAFLLNNEPVLFGTETSESEQNIGGAGFRFQRVEGSTRRIGLESKFAIEEINDRMVFLGSSVNQTPAIYISEGGRPEKISTTPIDNVLATYSQGIIENCFSWKYSQSGAQFIGFTFPGERTFIFDFTSAEWHTRESASGGISVPYRVSSVMDAYGVILVGDTLSNKIGILDRSVFTEYGENLRRRFVTPQIDNDGDPFWIDSLELRGESGVGLISGQGFDPMILMSFSNNGGRSYSNTIPRSLGQLGEYNHNTVWNSLGRFSESVCFKFEMSDPVKWVFTKLVAKLE